MRVRSRPQRALRALATTGLPPEGGGARAQRGGEAGFTLIELAIATAVLLLGVLLACHLFDESGRVLHHSVRRARDPWPLLAAELLRNDLRATDTARVQDPPSEPPLPPPLNKPQSLPMILRSDGDDIVWQRFPDGGFGRQVAGGDSHVYLQDVRDFRWLRVGGNAIEVRVRYHVSSPYLRQLAGSLPKADPGEDHELHLLVVARGIGGAQSW